MNIMQWNTCIIISGGDWPAPKEVRVKGCEEQPCTIKQGNDVNAEMDFEACKIKLFFV
jgi:hypothetical protein